MDTIDENIRESDSDNVNKKMLFDALITEYNTLRNEIISIQGEIHQLSLSAFASVAGLAALIVSLEKFSPVTLASVFIVLPFPFAAMVLSYLGHIAGLTNISKYILNQLEPSINKVIIAGSDATYSSVDALGWFKFQYTEMPGIRRWYSQGLWALGQGIIIGLPVIASLVGFGFTFAHFNLSCNYWWKLLLLSDLILVVIILVFTINAVCRYGLLKLPNEKKS